jgi:general secretion pathway protein D
MAEVQLAVISFFRSVGVELGPPKSVFFNDRQGTLLVYAGADDLDKIEAAIQTLNIAPPQVNVKAKFVEVSQNDNRALGFDWYLGNFLLGNKSVVGSGGTAPSFTGTPSTANPEGNFPGSSLFGTASSPSTSDQLITGGLRNTLGAPALATFTGILTDPQFRVVLRAMEQRDGADLLNEGQVTTLSGRQAQMSVVDQQFIITGNDTGNNNNNNNSGAQTTPSNGNTVIQNTPITINYTTQPLPFGSTLDVVPYVSADGYTIQMTLIPTVTEFVGYDDPGPFVPKAQLSTSSAIGVPVTGVLPLPRIRVRQVTTSAIVWDGQTIVLGGLITENVARVKDRVPILGDVPFVGRLFRNESNQTQKKSLIIFVTPTIIDPAGNRFHSEDELPFAQSAIPAQTAVISAP